MAVNIGPKIGIEGEAEYRRQLQNIIQTQKTLKAEMTEMKSAWGEQTSAEQKATQQASLLESQIRSQKQRIAELERGVDESAKAFGEADTRTLKWKEALATANAELNRMESELKDIPNNVELFGQKMQTAGQKIQKVGKGMETAGRGLTKYVTAPIVGLGTLAVKTTADFDTSMSNVRAISGATGDEFEALRNKAREMGATTKYSASESADALGYMALAGWDADQMIDGLDGVLNLAAASGMDLAEASDLVTDYLSAFGLEAADASKMADELAYAQANSNTTTTQLGDAFGNSAAMMHSAGQSMETTTAILESFANQGMKGSEAGTALSAMMRDIIQKMKNGKIYIGDTAVQVQDANGNFRDMTDILADVESATEGMGTAEKDAALMTTFTSRSIKGVNMVLNEGVGSVKKYREELFKADGTAKSMADIMQDNLAGQIKILASQLQELAISFGDILVPHVRKAVEWLQKQVDKFNSLDSATKEQIVKFAALAAAIGPVLLVGGKLVTSVGKIVEGGGHLISWLGKVAPGFGGVLAAAGPVAGAFGLAAGAGIILGNVLKSLNDKYGDTSAINDFNNYVRGTADAAFAARENLKESTSAVQETSANAEQVMKEVETSAQLTDRYAEELYELAGKTERTTEEQNRLEAIINILNGIYPGFTEAVMDSNGELKMGVEELKNYVKEIENVAKIKALQGIIEDLTEKIVDATARQIEAENSLAEAQEAASQAADKKINVQNSLSTNAERAEKSTKSYANAVKQEKFDIDAVNAAEYERIQRLGKMNNGLVEVEGETVKAADAIGQLTDSENLATTQADETQKAIDESKQVISETTEEVNGYQQQLDSLKDMLGLVEEQTDETSGSTDDAADSAESAGEAYTEYAEDVEDAADEIEEAHEKIIDSYISAFESAKESIMGQNDLWEQFEKKPETSVEAMISALNSHESALREWNTHSSSLLSSTRYATDSAFRDMVNSVIDGGLDLAPQLQVIYDLWASGDEQLDDLVSHYGSSDKAGEIYAQNMAESQTIAEYGIDNYNEAILGAIEEGQKAVESKFSNPTGIADSIQTGFANIGKVAKKYGKSAGQSVPESVATGMKDGKSDIQTASGTLESETSTGIGSIIKLAIDSVTAGLTISKGIAAGLSAGKPLINIAASGVTQSVRTGISNVSGLQSSAKSAGTSVSNSIKSGLESTSISGAMSTLSSAVKTGIDAIEAQKTSAKTAGETIGTNLETGLKAKEATVKAAGRVLGDAAANGVGGASANATTQGNKVINAAANALKKYEDGKEPKLWGRHMGDNFANGLGSAYANVVAQARNLANAVKNQLGHSTPKEGPLKHDDVWGLHLGQNFAEGMLQSIPAVESAAYGIADAAAMIPTATTLNIDALTGRNVAEALTLDGLFDVISAAVANQEMTVQIGNREFARILREQGAIA